MIKLALIGCGNFSDSLAAALQKSKKAELAVCCDPLSERRENCSRIYGCEPEENYERILKRKDIDEFADCIRTGEEPETGADGALAALAFVRAAIDSARLGKKIELARIS